MAEMIAYSLSKLHAILIEGFAVVLLVVVMWKILAQELKNTGKQGKGESEGEDSIDS